MENVKQILKDLEIDDEIAKKAESRILENYRTIAEVNKQKERFTADIEKRDADLKELQKQLKSAGTSKDKLDDISAKFEDLQKEYDGAKEDYKQQLEHEKYRYAVREHVDGLKFTSNSAKTQFTNEVIEKRLPMENGKILGFNDFVAGFKERDKNAFLDEKSHNVTMAGKMSGSNNDDEKENKKTDVPIIW